MISTNRIVKSIIITTLLIAGSLLNGCNAGTTNNDTNNQALSQNNSNVTSVTVNNRFSNQTLNHDNNLQINAYIATNESFLVATQNQNNGSLNINSLMPTSINSNTLIENPIVTDSTNSFAYVLNKDGSSLSLYSINKTTGIFSPLNPTPTITLNSLLTSIKRATINGNDYVYITSTNSKYSYGGYVYIYKINETPGNGYGNLININNVYLFGPAISINIDITKQYAYVAIGTSANGQPVPQIISYTINQNTGDLNITHPLQGMTLDSFATKILFHIENGQEYAYVFTQNYIWTFNISPIGIVLNKAIPVPYNHNIYIPTVVFGHTNQNINDIYLDYSLNNTSIIDHYTIQNGLPNYSNTVTMYKTYSQIVLDPSSNYLYAIAPGNQMDPNNQIDVFNLQNNHNLAYSYTINTNAAPQFMFMTANIKSPIPEMLIVTDNTGITYYNLDQNGDPVLPGNKINSLPMSIASFNPSGQYAYTTNWFNAGNGINQLNVTPNGALQLTNQTPFDESYPSNFILFNPNGKFAYFAKRGTNYLKIYQVDQESGTLINQNNGNYVYTMPTFDPSGKYAYDTYGNLYVYDNNTGVLALQQKKAFGNYNAGTRIRFNALESQLIVINTSSESNNTIYSFSIYNINEKTGYLTLYKSVSLPITESFPTSSDVQVDPSGEYLYLINSQYDAINNSCITNIYTYSVTNNYESPTITNLAGINYSRISYINMAFDRYDKHAYIFIPFLIYNYTCVIS